MQLPPLWINIYIGINVRIHKPFDPVIYKKKPPENMTSEIFSFTFE